MADPIRYSGAIDFSPLERLFDVYQNARLQGVREALPADMVANQPDQIARLLLGAGDLAGGLQFTKLADTREDKVYSRGRDAKSDARQAAQDAVAQRHWDATFGLQKRAADRADDPTPAGFQKRPDGMYAPLPGGPTDPGYMRSVIAAKTKPDEGLENEQKLRKEFETNSKTYLDVRRGYERINASKDDAAGDISMIFGYMKMLDPGSVVREGEFATAQNAAGIPDRLRNVYNKALEGTRLTPNQRTMFKGQAGALFDDAHNEHTQREGQFREIAKQYGLDPQRVIPAIGPSPRAKTMEGALPPLPAGFQVVR
jgi:hypothetical protein